MFTVTQSATVDAFILKERWGYLTGYPEIYFCRVRFNHENYHDRLFRQYDIHTDGSLQRAVVKRKAEYLAGRYCCASLLEQLGKETQVTRSHDRSPCWPAAVHGSLSHCKNDAIALLTLRPDCYPGVDIERFDAEVMRECAESITTPQERHYLHHSPLDYEQSILLAFSAKESLYKTLRRQLQHYLNFESVSIIHINPTTQNFRLCFNTALSDSYPKGMIITGYYQFDNENNDEKIITWVINNTAQQNNP